MSALIQFAPAKLNLFLAVTGRRTDGFHDLVSLAAPLELGDTLTVEVDPAEPSADAAGQFTLECSDPTLPVDDSNLVLKAARAFADRTGWKGRARFRLEKRIPAGAGLGGGSSDAAAVIRALNSSSGARLDERGAAEVAAEVGSDCPLFLYDGPVVMRGRGERIELLPAPAMRRVRGRRVVVFKPNFPISTPWVYARLAESAKSTGTGGRPAAYLVATEAERRLRDWIDRPEAPLAELLFNGLEQAVFPKFLALPTLLHRLQTQFGLAALMTGSGSACFALLNDDAPTELIRGAIRESWGELAYLVETKFA